MEPQQTPTTNPTSQPVAFITHDAYTLVLSAALTHTSKRETQIALVKRVCGLATTPQGARTRKRTQYKPVSHNGMRETKPAVVYMHVLTLNLDQSAR